MSITFRILGFTGIVRVECNRTTELLTHPHLEWPIYVNPISLLIIFWMSTSELRLYLFQARRKVCSLPSPQILHCIWQIFQSKRTHQSKREGRSKRKTVDHRSTKGKPPTVSVMVNLYASILQEVS